MKSRFERVEICLAISIEDGKKTVEEGGGASGAFSGRVYLRQNTI